MEATGAASLTMFPPIIFTGMMLADENRKPVTIPSSMSRQRNNDSVRWFKGDIPESSLQKTWITKDLNERFSTAP